MGEGALALVSGIAQGYANEKQRQRQEELNNQLKKLTMKQIKTAMDAEETRQRLLQSLPPDQRMAATLGWKPKVDIRKLNSIRRIEEEYRQNVVVLCSNCNRDLQGKANSWIKPSMAAWTN